MNIAGRQPRTLQWAVLAPVCLAVACWLGITMATGGNRRYALIALAAIVVIARPVKIFIDRRVGPGALAIELPILLLVASTLVWRQRAATALAANPLDSAAQFRVLFVGLALILGIAALTSPPRPEATFRARLTTFPFRTYLCYLGVVLLGVASSVKPTLTLYRAVEVATGCIVLLGAYRAFGNAAARRIEATLYWSTVALVGSIWLGRVLWPDQAIARPLNEAVPLKWELTGVYPQFAANSVGALGALLAVWSLCRYINPRRYPGRRGFALFLTLVGIATTIAAQYRTGYIAVVASMLVVFWLRRRILFVALAVTALFFVLWSPSLVTDAEPYVLRGQTTDEAQELSGRVDYWSAAIPVWEKSPIIGRGLWTASRYEVLEPLGLENTASVHSTWVEGLVGTGVVGVSLLAVAVLSTVARAWRVARSHRWAPIGPLALMIMLLVRSTTGNLFESFGHEQLVFLAIALALEDRVKLARPQPVTAGFPREAPVPVG